MILRISYLLLLFPVLIFPVRASSYTPTGALADYLSLEIFQLVAMVKLILLVTLFQVLVSCVWLLIFLAFSFSVFFV